MRPLIARRQLLKVLAVDAVAFPAIALVLLTAPPGRLLVEVLAIFLASTALQAILFMQGVRASRDPP